MQQPRSMQFIQQPGTEVFQRSAPAQPVGTAPMMQQPRSMQFMPGMVQQPGSVQFIQPGTEVIRAPGMTEVIQQPGVTEVIQQPGMEMIIQQPGMEVVQMEQPGSRPMIQPEMPASQVLGGGRPMAVPGQPATG